MTRQCDFIRDLMPLYIDKVCSKDSVDKGEAHLNECTEYTKLLSNYV